MGNINPSIHALLIIAGTPSFSILRQTSSASLFAVPAVSLCCVFARAAGQAADALTPNAPTERELAGGQTHRYRVELKEGQYLRLAVKQRGVDNA
jgi:hypothetical protein